jgi:hypothetical protein
MMVTIHQPEHLPWTGFFHKMSMAEAYVILDAVPFTKNNWQNRNKLVDREGKEFWVTVPVIMKGHTTSTIRNIAIDNAQEWRRKYLGRIEQAYCRHPFYPQYAPDLRAIVMHPHLRLFELNMALIRFLRQAMGISTPIWMASELGVSGKQSTLLLDICRKLDADRYLSGPSGRNYLDRELFARAGIGIDFHEFKPPAYKAEQYVPGLSTLDVLFNHGPQSARIIGLKATATRSHTPLKPESVFCLA